MRLIWTEMTEDMKKRIGELIYVAPWTELNLESDGKRRGGKARNKERGKYSNWTDGHIGVEGAKMISGSLKINTTLTKLNLSGDDIIIKWRNNIKN